MLEPLTAVISEHWFKGISTKMADLDDFFAKKDRKKSKGKKFTTTEDIAKKMEETGRKIEKPLKEKMTSLPGPFGPDGDDIMGNNEVSSSKQMVMWTRGFTNLISITI